MYLSSSSTRKSLLLYLLSYITVGYVVKGMGKKKERCGFVIGQLSEIMWSVRDIMYYKKKKNICDRAVEWNNMWSVRDVMYYKKKNNNI